MSGRKQSTKPRVDRTSVWIERQLIRDAKKIASHEGTKLSQVIEAMLRGPVARKVAKLSIS